MSYCKFLNFFSCTKVALINKPQSSLMCFLHNLNRYNIFGQVYTKKVLPSIVIHWKFRHTVDEIAFLILYPEFQKSHSLSSLQIPQFKKARALLCLGLLRDDCLLFFPKYETEWNKRFLPDVNNWSLGTLCRLSPSPMARQAGGRWVSQGGYYSSTREASSHM